MGLNETPAANRIHIGFFGKRNAGKSSMVNAITGQNLSVVSPVAGTTTDPVYKSMELLPLGPVVIIDTPGFDDEGSLGGLRIQKARQVLNKTDFAVLVLDGTTGKTKPDEELEQLIQEKEIPYLVVYNKLDCGKEDTPDTTALWVSAKEQTGIEALKEKIAELAAKKEAPGTIVSDLLEQGDMVILVTPIDQSAPKGRLILPQQQTIRDILDADAQCVVTKETQLEAVLAALKEKPKLVITDSQAFSYVSKVIPPDVLLTSFSILFARYKGQLQGAVAGARELKQITDGDRILIAEGCTHHRQCEDIGTVKLPKWIREFTKAEPEFVFTSGTDFPDDLSSYRLVVHCGGCMLNERQMRYRQKKAGRQAVPMTNYGIAIAFMNGILERSIQVFGNKFEV